jgi:hypothetical protein
MDAVNSPIGPEIEEYDLASKVLKLELPPPCVNPVELVRKFGSVDSGSGRKLACHFV